MPQSVLPSRSLWVGSALVIAAAVVCAYTGYGCVSPDEALPDASANGNQFVDQQTATAGTQDQKPVSFWADVLPIFEAHCAVCHSPGRTADRLGISMRLTAAESYSSTVNQASSQSPAFLRVVPGDPENSLLYLKVSMDQPPIGNRMPLACSKLDPAELAAIYEWIKQGAPQN